MKDTHINHVSLEQITPLRNEKLDLVGKITSLIRKEILSGRFPAKSLLPSEYEMAQHMGVSRPVIREALRILSAQGLVEISHGRRPRVKDADTQASIVALDALLRRSNSSMLDLIEARRVLEGHISFLAAERAGKEDIEKLEQSIMELENATEAEAACQADIEFHRYLALASRNIIFQLLLETLRGPLSESLRQTFNQAGIECALKGHVPILKAIKEKDGQKARKAMLEHLEVAEEHLLKQLRK